MRKFRILMLGTSTGTRGGIASVERVMLEACRDIRYRHIATHSDASFGKLALFMLACLRLLLLSPAHFDLAHIHFSVRGSLYRKYLLSRLLRWKGIPYVLHCHAPVSFLDGELPGWRSKVGRMLRDSCGLIALSTAWASLYQRLADGVRVWTLGNPVQLPELPARPPNAGTASLLFLGRIGERKGAFELLEAMRSLEKAAPGRARLTMAGDGELARARRFVRRAGLTGCVELRGWVDADAKAQLLSTSDILVLPSRAEGLPMALLEAMAYGLAVVATPVGGIADVIVEGHNGMTVPPGDPHALYRVLLRLVNEPSLRRLLGERARCTVAALTPASYADRLKAIYAEALAERNAERLLWASR